MAETGCYCERKSLSILGQLPVPELDKFRSQVDAHRLQQEPNRPVSGTERNPAGRCVTPGAAGSWRERPGGAQFTQLGPAVQPLPGPPSPLRLPGKSHGRKSAGRLPERRQCVWPDSWGPSECVAAWGEMWGEPPPTPKEQKRSAQSDERVYTNQAWQHLHVSCVSITPHVHSSLTGAPPAIPGCQRGHHCCVMDEGSVAGAKQQSRHQTEPRP